MLHVISHTENQIDKDELLGSLQTTDAILLTQDGVTIAVTGNRLLPSLVQQTAALYVLRPDLSARGLERLIDDKLTVIDYDDYVDLTVEQVSQRLW